MAKHQTIGASEIHTAIDRLAASIAQRHAGIDRLLLLGIANGGIELARRLSISLPKHAPRLPVHHGVIDISFHRDDIAQHPVPKEFAPTQIPVDVQGATVVLVDDVLFSGRTVKAALDELFDHGRPTKVELAVLVDRGGRRLPVSADHVGLTVSASEREKVRVALNATRPHEDEVRIESASLAQQRSAL